MEREIGELKRVMKGSKLVDNAVDVMLIPDIMQKLDQARVSKNKKSFYLIKTF